MKPLVALVGSARSFSPPVLPDQVGTRLRPTSCQITQYPRLKLPPLPDDMARVYDRLFSAAFPAPSRYAMCRAASWHLGCCPGTIENIITGTVSKADYRIIALATWVYEQRTGRPFELAPGLAARLIGGAS